MAQLGVGLGSDYPRRIDMRQVFQNSPLAGPDDETRVDAEVLNDDLDATVKMQRTLGAMPNGQYASLAARLNQFIPGGGAPVTSEAFPASLTWTLPGALHHLGSPAMLLYAYDGSDPAAWLDPGTATVDPTSYDIEATFGSPQAGLLVVTLGQPSYTTTFTDVTSLTVLGAAHQLGTADFCWQVRDSAGAVISPASLTVHTATFDVTLTFGQAQSGRLILGVPGEVSSTPFTTTTPNEAVTITGATHGLGTRALVWQVWDAGSPTRTSFDPASVTVDPDTFDITFTFGQAGSGHIVLGKAIGATGSDFTLLDTGIPNQTAVRVYSNAGTLNLQHGAGDATVLRNKQGSAVATVNATGQMGLGTTPTHQLHLSTDDAAKLATATWATTSDERLKDVLRPYGDGLDLLMVLEPIWYRYNGLGGIRKDNREYVGLLAQAVQEVAPYMVTSRRGRLRDGEEETDILELNTSPLIFALMNAVKTLASQVTALTQDLAAIRAQLAAEEPN